MESSVPLYITHNGFLYKMMKTRDSAYMRNKQKEYMRAYRARKKEKQKENYTHE